MREASAWGTSLASRVRLAWVVATKLPKDRCRPFQFPTSVRSPAGLIGLYRMSFFNATRFFRSQDYFPYPLINHAVG